MSVSILTGDALDVLRGMPDESFDCCVTSPPYWGLRDYGVPGQIGLEPSLGEHLDVMVALFREVRRVLKPTGALWLNYGDCYATAPNGRSAADTKAAGTDDRTFRDKPFGTVGPVYDPAGERRSRTGGRDNLGNSGGDHPGAVVAGGYLKPKDLCMLPNRLAIALQDDGWWVRSEIIWGKPNAMPDSSGAYRPSTSHEKIFLMTKSGDADVWRARDTGELSFAPDLAERCPLVTRPDVEAARWVRLGSYYDAEAVKLKASESTHARLAQDVMNQIGSARANGGAKGNGPMKAVGAKRKFDPGKGNRNNESFDAALQLPPRARLLRNFEDGAALAELAPPDVMAWEIAIQGFSGAHFATFPPALVVPCVIAGCPPGGRVLDPFGGAGTTGMVASRLGREAVLIELNHDYAALARDRLRAAMVRVTSDLPERPRDEGGLFSTQAEPATGREEAA